MFNFQEADDAVFEPEYLRHVSDDVAAHLDDTDKLDSPVPNRWEILASRMEALYSKA
jgi:hypothetical protein